MPQVILVAVAKVVKDKDSRRAFDLYLRYDKFVIVLSSSTELETLELRDVNNLHLSSCHIK